MGGVCPRREAHRSLRLGRVCGLLVKGQTGHLLVGVIDHCPILLFCIGVGKDNKKRKPTDSNIDEECTAGDDDTCEGVIGHGGVPSGQQPKHDGQDREKDRNDNCHRKGAGERSDGENQRKRRKAVAPWLRFQFHNIVSVLGKMQSMKCLHFPRSFEIF